MPLSSFALNFQLNDGIKSMDEVDVIEKSSFLALHRAFVRSTSVAREAGETRASIQSAIAASVECFEECLRSMCLSLSTLQLTSAKQLIPHVIEDDYRIAAVSKLVSGAIECLGENLAQTNRLRCVSYLGTSWEHSQVIRGVSLTFKEDLFVLKPLHFTQLNRTIVITDPAAFASPVAISEWVALFQLGVIDVLILSIVVPPSLLSLLQSLGMGIIADIPLVDAIALASAMQISVLSQPAALSQHPSFRTNVIGQCKLSKFQHLLLVDAQVRSDVNQTAAKRLFLPTVTVVVCERTEMMCDILTQQIVECFQRVAGILEAGSAVVCDDVEKRCSVALRQHALNLSRTPLEYDMQQTVLLTPMWESDLTPPPSNRMLQLVADAWDAISVRKEAQSELIDERVDEVTGKLVIVPRPQRLWCMQSLMRAVETAARLAVISMDNNDV